VAADAFNSSRKMHRTSSISCGFKARQFEHLERRGGAQAERALSESSACVQINLVGKQVQFCADAQGRVIDVKLAESRNRFEGRVNELASRPCRSH